jgi:hypothetical protein
MFFTPKQGPSAEPTKLTSSRHAIGLPRSEASGQLSFGDTENGDIRMSPLSLPGDKPAAAATMAELTSQGRFAEPAIQLVIGQTSDWPTRSRLEAVLAEVRGHK